MRFPQSWRTGKIPNPAPARFPLKEAMTGQNVVSIHQRKKGVDTMFPMGQLSMRRRPKAALLLLAAVVTVGGLVGGLEPGLAQGESASIPPTSEDPGDVFVNRCLAEFDGLVTQDHVLCGTLQGEILTFRLEGSNTARSYRVDQIAALLGRGKGQVDVFLRGGDRLRGFWVDPDVAFGLALRQGNSLTVTVSTERIDMLLLRGGILRLPLEDRLAVFDRITHLFRQLRLRADIFVLENGAVLSGRLLTPSFQIRIGDKTETYFKSQIARILREADGKITLFLRNQGSSGQARVQGEAVTTTLELRLLGTETVSIPLSETRQVIMQHGGIRYCNTPHCTELVEFTRE